MKSWLPFIALLTLPAALLAAPPDTTFKFQFGAASAAPGYTLVPLTQVYDKTAGYGFEPGAGVTGSTADTGEPCNGARPPARGRFCSRWPCRRAITG